MHRIVPAALLLLAIAPHLQAAPNFKQSTARPLHFRPEQGAFVVENGPEFFNRPLYGGNTAFRADAGDKPEISFYLPGRGGVLRLGIKTPTGQKWLNDATKIITRYIPGSMTYEITDPLLGTGQLNLNVQAMHEAEGIVVQTTLNGTNTPVELIWAYGGANGERAARNGDIGTEKLPMSQYFQLKASHCQDSKFSLDKNSFTLHTNRATIVGLAPADSTFTTADASKWSRLDDLLNSKGAATTPVAITHATLQPGQPLYLSLERTGSGTESKASSYTIADLPRVFEAAEKRRREVAEKVIVDTPDPYINAAASALCVAADGVWDEKSRIFMHGAVAWRNPYLGWRGAYAGTELGWPDRTRDHLSYWFKKQNTNPVAPGAGEPQEVKPDLKANYARNEPELHSNGDLTNSHYDMNIPAIDILFRHLLWNADVQYAKTVWPVIERHLAWERRLFRRPFGPEKLPLYEAYVCIWASDDLQYNGGGVTHATAYNYYHNVMAARVAKLIGQDAAPYEKEAALIKRGLESQLWLKDKGWYAEWKDLLGLQQTHPNAALWTFYHTVDSEVPNTREAWQMTRFVDTQTPHIPIHGPGVPTGDYFTLSTTSWMPYTWSTNNVVMAEAAHTSLGYWQANRPETANKLFKGLLLDSMYLGLTPGNVGMCTYFDMARGESQRDFADGVGTTSRALIEGLFGVRPDALAGHVQLQPGFPAEWNRAAIQHPNFTFRFQREGLRETYSFTPKFQRPLALNLNIPALRDQIDTLTVNGQPAKWTVQPDAVGTPRIQIQTLAAPAYEIAITWKGQTPTAPIQQTVQPGSAFQLKLPTARPLEISDPQQTLLAPKLQPNGLEAKLTAVTGEHTAFARVQQGDLQWWLPINLSLRPAFEIQPSETQTPTELRFTLRNNTGQPYKGDASVQIGKTSLKLKALNLPANQTSTELKLPATGLLPGTHEVTINLGTQNSSLLTTPLSHSVGDRVPAKRVEGVRARQVATTQKTPMTAITGQITNWHLPSPTTRWESLDLAPTFNDKVTQIFKNEYLSPRSPYVSLAIPKQGIGSWADLNEQFEVDDSGLRSLNGKLTLPQGIPFQTPSDDTKNIAFTSQWDNYPRSVEVPLQGNASHLYLLMAGSTNSMQSRFDNGEIIVTYTDGSTERLPLHNPTTWWPIDQDYKTDDYAFAPGAALPPRVDLKTGTVRVLDPATFKGKGGKIPGGAATVLDLPLQPNKPLKSLTLRTLANEVIIGLMSATLVRE